MTKLTRKQLNTAAAELNEEFGLEPSIKFGKKESDELVAEGIKKASVMHDPDTDELTAETLAVMDALKETDAPKKAKPAPAEEVPEPEYTEDEQEMLDALKETKKTDALKELLEDPLFDDVRDALADEKNPIKLKAAMKRHLTGEVISSSSAGTSKPSDVPKKPKWKVAIEEIVKNPKITPEQLMAINGMSEGSAAVYVKEISYVFECQKA